MSLGIGETPKWFKEFSWREFFFGVKEDVKKIPKVVGDTISGVAKPILSGARSALSPTIIWLVVIAIIGLILFTYFKKAVKI